MIALGRALAGRGHDVTLQTWTRWRADVEAQGMTFAAAPEYPVFPTRERPLSPYQAVELATRDTQPLVEALAPDAIVADILTLAPALAGELHGVPVATLVPHVDPRTPAGSAPYSSGARLPRTALGRALWRGADPLLRRGLELGRSELNETRRRVGLRPQARVHGGISEALCLVATFPQLEYPRPAPPGTHTVGPLLWEPPSDDVALPAGDDPLVLLAPSTSQDPEQRLLRAAIEGLASMPVRVLASSNRSLPDPPLPIPAERDARRVAVLRAHDAALRPRRLPRRPRHGRAGARQRLRRRRRARRRRHERERRARGLGRRRRPAAAADGRRAGPAARGRARARPPGLRARARELERWAAEHDGPTRAAELVEAFAQRSARARPTAAPTPARARPRASRSGSSARSAR